MRFIKDRSSLFRSKVARRFRDTFKDVDIDGEALHREVMELHAKRRTGPIKGESPHKLSRVAARDQAIRTRLTGILMQIDTVLHSLEEHRKATIADMMVTYADRLPKLGVTDMRTYLQAGLAIHTPWLEALEIAREAARLVVTDIDKSGYGFRLRLDSFELDTRPERQF